MATTTTRHPPSDQPALVTPPDTATSVLACLDVVVYCAFLILLGLTIWNYHYYTVTCNSTVVSQPSTVVSQPPLFLPSTILLSSFTATPLISNTTPASLMNLTLLVVNPNPHVSIYYTNFTLLVHYNINNFKYVTLGVNDMGHFNQTGKEVSVLTPMVSFSTKKLEDSELVEKFLDDQRNGGVGVNVSASYLMKYENGEDWKMNDVSSGGLQIMFEKLSAKGTGLLRSCLHYLIKVYKI